MRWTGRFFLRNKALCALFAGMVIIPSGATVYFGILKMSGFELLYNLVRIQYIIDLVWVSMTAFFTVSYTHLDVYKRQVYMQGKGPRLF